MAEKKMRMKGSERRAFIIEQAKKVFARSSYADASTGELARASEVTEPMLYKHFGSKKALFLAVIQTASEAFFCRFRKRVQQRAEHDLLEALSSILLDYRAAALSDPDDVFVRLHSSVETSDPDIQTLVRSQMQDVYQAIFELLKRAQEQGVLPASLDLNAATWGYLSFFFAIEYRAKLGIFASFNEETIREVNRLWLQGLRQG